MLWPYRRKDKVCLLDLAAVGLIGDDWLGRLPEDLAGRLRELLADPEG